MKKRDFTWEASDGKVLYVHRWIPEEKPRSLLLIAHGMAEHGLRYAPLANALAERGWVVCAPDHRGHGRSAEQEERGWFAERDGFRRVIEDLYEIAQEMRRRHGGAGVFLFGHCMGSLIAQGYAGLYGQEIQGAVWSGIIDEPTSVQRAAGRLFSGLGCLLNGQMARAPVLDHLSIGANNRAFEPARTAFDWLSRDQAEVDKYVADPLCGFICSYGFFRDLFSGFELVYGRDGVLARIPQALPLLVLAGEADPMGGARGAVQRLAGRLRDAGLSRVDTRLYSGARHELLNETNRGSVIADVTAWLESVAEAVSSPRHAPAHGKKASARANASRPRPHNARSGRPQPAPRSPGPGGALP
jgi:alpha-beta hydrolase superfamily lysophospholipase